MSNGSWIHRERSVGNMLMLETVGPSAVHARNERSAVTIIDILSRNNQFATNLTCNGKKVGKAEWGPQFVTNPNT